jgi:predicted nuclease of restriction endonuclease-like RecB superfamily
MARFAGARAIAALGIKYILDREYRTEVGAAADPERIRETVFLRSAKGGSRTEILVDSASELDISTAEVERGLFADRSSARVVTAPSRASSPHELVLDYNLALVQGLVLRAERLHVGLSESVRSVVRYAKLRGLLATFTVGTDGRTCLDLSGPLALFRNTLKYGRALALFLPAALATPGSSFDARCRLNGRVVSLRVDAGDPLARKHALPRDYDSAVERALVRAVRRLGTERRIMRETEPLRAGSRLFFPDFTLVRGTGRVLVEVVGYYTPEYLDRKRAALATAGVRNLIVCVDDALDCGERPLTDGAVLRFRRRVDAEKLLRAAEALLAQTAPRTGSET